MLRSAVCSAAILMAAGLVPSGVVPSAVPAAALAVWERPVPGPVVRPFQAPVSRYGPGHLGVDFAAAPGSSVRAAGAGIVVFAGVVAGAMHVVISHAGNLRSSYSFLASIEVRRGAEVARGAVIGTTGGRGEQHDGSVLHVGLRVGDAYVDPMRLFGPPDLAAVVHLAPIGTEGRAASASARGLSPPPTRSRVVSSPPPSGFSVVSGRRTALGTPLYPR